MTLFAPKHFTEDDLIALHLGELPPRRARLLRRALSQDAGLRAQAAEIAATLELFRAPSPVAPGSAALERAWQDLRPSLPVLRGPAPSVPSPARWRTPALAAAGGVAALGTIAVVVSSRHTSGPVQTPGSPGVATWATPADDVADGANPTSGWLRKGPILPSSRPGGEFSKREQEQSSSWQDNRHIVFAHSAEWNLRRRTAPPLGPARASAHPIAPASPAVTSVHFAAFEQMPALPEAPSALAQACTCVPAAAPGKNPKPRRNTSTHHVLTTLTLGAAGDFTLPRTQNLEQHQSDSAAVLGGVEQNFRPWLGYAVRMSYSRASTTYRYPGTGSSVNVPANVYELSLSYAARKRLARNLVATTQAGGGVLTYLPTSRVPSGTAFLYPGSGQGLPVNFRPLGAAAVGLQYPLGRHLGVRAEYRALVYKFPDYGQYDKPLTVTSQPAVSLTYSFGGQ